MKVVQIAESFAYGTAKSVKQLVGILSNEHDVTVYYGDRDGTTVETAELDSRVKWVPLPGKGPLRHLTNLRFLQKHIDRDVRLIHGHSSFGGAYAKVLGLLRRTTRILYSPRGYAFLRLDHGWMSRNLFWLFERFSSRFCKTVACGPSELSYANSMSGNQSIHIGNGWNIPDDVDTQQVGTGVISVGRISVQKGFDKFLDIARSLPDVHFDWIGSAEEGQEGMAADVPSNVTITDYMPHDEVLTKIRKARFVLLPSRWEGLSRFLVESVCYGKAIITSECEANVDCLDADGTGGFQNGFRCQSIKEYVAAIQQLQVDDALVRRMQEGSSRYAKRCFDIDSIAAQWLSLYDPATWGKPLKRKPTKPGNRTNGSKAISQFAVSEDIVHSEGSSAY